MNELYLRTARLLVQVAPSVFVNDTFALKGGTAINLFFCDLPRLSVDLDLVYRDHTVPRQDALQHIDAELRMAAQRLSRRGYTVRPVAASDGVTSLLIDAERMSVKVEVNVVMRGTVFPVQHVALSPRAEELLRAELTLPLASRDDTYGGKLAAAMDRQHPRDLFDVLCLYEQGGITPAMRSAFVVYAASHNRPVHELLFPREKDIALEYSGAFDGMTANPVPIERLIEARARLLNDVQTGLTVAEREFLISLVSATPAWELLDIPHLHALPGIRWKLRNLEQLRDQNRKKFEEQCETLVSRLR